MDKSLITVLRNVAVQSIDLDQIHWIQVSNKSVDAETWISHVSSIWLLSEYISYKSIKRVRKLKN